MSNHHWVCFACRECREAVRRPGTSSDVRCPACGEPCRHLGAKVPVPPKSKSASWKTLETAYFGRRRTLTALLRRRAVRRKHDLEREIGKIEALPENEGRRSLLAKLRADLESVGARCL